ALRIHDAHGAAHGVTEVAGYATQAVLHLGVVVGLVVGEPHPVDAAHVSTLWILDGRYLIVVQSRVTSPRIGTPGLNARRVRRLAIVAIVIGEVRRREVLH